MTEISALEVGDEDLSVSVRNLEHDVAVVSVRGEIDIATAPTLRHPLITLVENGRHHLVLDLSGVGFMDSSGLGVLIRVLPHVQSRGGTMRLAQLQPNVLRILRIAGLTQVFPVYDTPAEALADEL
jgi:anti-sigma B factor antagonist